MSSIPRFFLRAIACLPLPFVHALGSVLGWLAYGISPTYRRHFRDNLAAAGISDPAARRAAIGAAGQMIAEMPYVWLRPREQVLALVQRVEGEAAVHAARAAGRGIVFLTPHIGCFEITAQVAGSRLPITALYRPPKEKWLQPVVEAGRGGGNVRLAPADVGGVRELLSALRRGEAVGILPDQVPGEGEGEWAEFFGKPAYTMTLAGKLLERPNVAGFLAFGERLPGKGYVVHVQPLPERRAGESAARFVNRATELLAAAHPGQYLWGYNRYKRPRGAPPPP